MDCNKEHFESRRRNERNARRWRAIALFKAAGHFVSVAACGTIPVILLDAARVPAPPSFVVGLVWAAGVLFSAGAWWVWSGKTLESYLYDVQR